MSPKSRLESFKTGNPYAVRVVFSLRRQDYNKLERAAHRELRDYHHCREWFKCSPEIAKEAILKCASEPYKTRHKKDIQAALSGELSRSHSAFSSRYIKHQKKRSEVIESIQENGSDVIELTEQIIKAGMTGGKGMPSHKAKILGLKFPLKKGWIKKLVGVELAKDRILSYLAA